MPVSWVLKNEVLTKYQKENPPQTEQKKRMRYNIYFNAVISGGGLYNREHFEEMRLEM
jgi:hypothetical protein